MKAIKLPPQSAEQVHALDDLYRTTKEVRIRLRVQIILLAVEQKMTAPPIATIVRKDEQTVRRWLKRYQSEGIEGLKDAPRPGGQWTVTPQYLETLVASVRRRPRSLGQPYSMWTCQRLADHLAEETGLRLSDESVRRYLAAEDIVLSRPDPEYVVQKRRLKKRETR